jgi:phosphatidylserine/phosphatidylglycerophosphate/cardiolipin synthase-like enzyme
MVISALAHAAPPMDVLPAQGVYVNAQGSPLLPLLQNARNAIDIEIYTMGDKTVRRLIREALARGVKVRILKDPNPLGDSCDLFSGAASSSADCADQQKLVSDVRAAGSIFEPFNKQALCPNGGGKSGTLCYEHGKIALADGIALVSTGNFDNTNLCIDGATKCDRDFTLIYDDATVYGTLQSIFDADLKGVSYDVRSLIPASLQDTLTVSPDSLTPIVNFINSAKESIDLEAQYLKEPHLNAALEAAANRGVRVSVTVASACAFGKPAASAAAEIQSVYTAFDRDGISSRFFNASNRIDGNPGYMHAKVIVVDGTRAWLGSENGSSESLTENREYGVIFDNADWVRTILDTVKADHDSPDSESWEESLSCAKDSGRGQSTGGGSAVSVPPQDAPPPARAPSSSSSGKAPRAPRKPRKPKPLP